MSCTYMYRFLLAMKRSYFAQIKEQTKVKSDFLKALLLQRYKRNETLCIWHKNINFCRKKKQNKRKHSCYYLEFEDVTKCLKLKLWVRIPFRCNVLHTTLCQWWSLSVTNPTCDRLVVFSRHSWIWFPQPIKLTTTV